MNERIKELSKQAQQYAEYVTPQGCEWLDTFKEKFAELIVFECVNAVMDGTKEGDHYAMRIEQHFDNGQGGILHFGVEELPVCKHDWYSAKNPVVQNGSVCVICGAIDAREPEELKND